MTTQTLDAARIIATRPPLGALANLFSTGFEAAPSPTPAERRAKRRRMFAESPIQGCIRMIRAAGAAMRLSGVKGCFQTLKMIMREATAGAPGLPSPESALARPDGLCCAVRDFSAAHLAEAYQSGLFPAAHIGPMRWWAPSSRVVAEPEQVMDLYLRDNEGLDNIIFDRAFDEAVCAREARIAPRLKWAFAKLFDVGMAHSFEVYNRQGAQVGRGFGVAIGGVFVIEAMHWRDAKGVQAGLATLAQALCARGFSLIDAKYFSAGLAASGFIAMSRADYNSWMKRTAAAPSAAKWKAPVLQAA